MRPYRQPLPEFNIFDGFSSRECGYSRMGHDIFNMEQNVKSEPELEAYC